MSPAGNLSGDVDAVLQKQTAAKISLAFNVVSTVIKIGAAVITGSLGLLSEAIHSATDIVTSALALWSVRAAAVPADDDHPYGHGKIESLAGFGESILLLGITAFILIEATHRLSNTTPVEAVPVGIAVMGASALGATVCGWYVQRVAKQTHSLALASNAQHLFVDALTSAGVLLSLLVIHFTGWVQADPAFALLIAIWIGWGAWRISHQAFHELIDVRLPDSEIDRINQILGQEPGVLGYHRLRTRRSGGQREIDVHIVVPRDWSVVQAHDVADRLELTLETELAPALVTIHVDPDDPESPEEPR